MEVKDFDATAQAISKNGRQIALEKFAVPGSCWQGYFLDLEDNAFGSSQVDQTPNSGGPTNQEQLGSSLTW
jgi:uncharacterized protein